MSKRLHLATIWLVAVGTVLSAYFILRSVFEGTAAAIAATVAAIFISVFPDIMPSTISTAYSLTRSTASSTPYTLRIVTVVALVSTPMVLLYQGWTCWVFRKRIGVRHIPQ